MDFCTNQPLHLEAGENSCFVIVNLSYGIEKKELNWNRNDYSDECWRSSGRGSYWKKCFLITSAKL